MKKLIVSLVVVLVVLTGSSAAVFAHTRTSSHVAVPAIVTTACSETGLTGADLQENKIYCNSSPIVVAPCLITDIQDGSIFYTAAIGAANKHVMVGTVMLCTGSNDWSGLPIIYVEFSNGEYHGEAHGDNVARIYDANNHQVYP